MRRLLFIAGTLAALALTLVLLGFHALKSETGKETFASALSSALGQPVVMADMPVLFLPTPTLEMKQIRTGSVAHEAAPAVVAAGPRVVPKLLLYASEDHNG